MKLRAPFLFSQMELFRGLAGAEPRVQKSRGPARHGGVMPKPALEVAMTRMSARLRKALLRPKRP